LQLDSKQEKMLKGEFGEARQLAMQILVKVGDAMEADTLVPITSAHVLAHYSSLHEAGIEMLERFSEAGGKFAVKTTVDPASVDLENWRSFRIPERYASKQFRLQEAYSRLGGDPCWTCTQYQVCSFPRKSDVVAWAESSAVVFANSLIGCRTNRITSGLDIACAMSGLTPNYGMLLDENRIARVSFKLDIRRPSDLDYRSIGFFIGRHAGARVPALVGLPKLSTSDDLKHLGAAAATGGPVNMIHFIGRSPGSKTLRNATAGESVETIALGRSDLEEVEQELNETEERPDLVVLGVPHLSPEELNDLAARLGGRRLKRGIRMYVYTSQQAYNHVTRNGLRARIEASGARLSHSTDGEISPLRELGFKIILTNSAKMAETMMSEGGIKMRYASLRDIIEETTT